MYGLARSIGLRVKLSYICKTNSGNNGKAGLYHKK